MCKIRLSPCVDLDTTESGCPGSLMDNASGSVLVWITVTLTMATAVSMSTSNIGGHGTLQWSPGPPLCLSFQGLRATKFSTSSLSRSRLAVSVSTCRWDISQVRFGMLLSERCGHGWVDASAFPLDQMRNWCVDARSSTATRTVSWASHVCDLGSTSRGLIDPCIHEWPCSSRYTETSCFKNTAVPAYGFPFCQMAGKRFGACSSSACCVPIHVLRDGDFFAWFLGSLARSLGDGCAPCWTGRSLC